MEAVFPSNPGTVAGGGRCVFEWMEGGQFLVERTEAPDPAPDSLIVIAFDPDTGAYRQHYFDTRGVARIYAMTFDGQEWQLHRDQSDFSPLDFYQRFVGTVGDGGDTIRGVEISFDGTGGEHDFDLTYRREH